MARSTRDLAGLALGVGTLVGTAALARRPISRTEVLAFRTVNDLPEAGWPAIWLPMQYGTFGTVPASAVLAFARNRPRLALAIGVGGTAAWLSAKASSGSSAGNVRRASSATSSSEVLKKATSASHPDTRRSLPP